MTWLLPPACPVPIHATGIVMDHSGFLYLLLVAVACALVLGGRALSGSRRRMRRRRAAVPGGRAAHARTVATISHHARHASRYGRTP